MQLLAVDATEPRDRKKQSMHWLGDHRREERIIGQTTSKLALDGAHNSREYWEPTLTGP